MEKYNQFIIDMSKAGWIIEIRTNIDGSIDGYIRHNSWTTNDLYASGLLPTFVGYSIEGLLDKIMDYVRF